MPLIYYNIKKFTLASFLNEVRDLIPTCLIIFVVHGITTFIIILKDTASITHMQLPPTLTQEPILTCSLEGIIFRSYHIHYP